MYAQTGFDISTSVFSTIPSVVDDAPNGINNFTQLVVGLGGAWDLAHSDY